MKGKAKAGYVLARIAEALMWLSAAVMALGFLAGLIDPEAISVMTGTGAADARIAVPMVPGGLGRMVITGPDGELVMGSYMLYIGAAVIELVLTALVFRRIWQIIKLSWASTPFQKPVVDKVKQIGWLFIAAPLVTLAVSLVNFVINWPELSVTVDMTSIITGVIVLALSQIFAYGVKLENDVEGLL